MKRLIIITSLWMFFIYPPFSVGQDAPTADTIPAVGNATELTPTESLKLKLDVNEIRLDVVVLDKKGNPVTNLTADDFEISQDGKRQDVVASVYIDNQA